MSPRRVALSVLVAVGFAVAPTTAPAAAATSVRQAATAVTHPVGVTQRTFVDHSRPTDANGDCAELPSRTLRTTIYYPAIGDAPSTAPAPDAAPDRANGPYPLIAFSHGFDSDPKRYESLLEHWAAAGYVVAAPQFPLSSDQSACGAIAGDVVNQPTDISFVITSISKATHRDALLRNLVDTKKIGAAGHSNGGITTYGLSANTRLHDPRLDVAVVLAGTPQKYPTGRYDFTKAPPLLIVHGTADDLVPYSAAVRAFNHARGPKGILTVEGGDHGSAAGPETYPATTDMFDAYLRGDSAAADRLPDDQLPGASKMEFVAERGSATTIPTVPEVHRHLKAKVTPSKNLTDGQAVTVTWSGYTPGKVVNILQCNPSSRHLSNGAGCDYLHARLLHPDPSGEGSVTMSVVEGKVGDGTCDAKHQGCVIIVNNESSTDPRDSVVLPITFAK
jgi:fermentation-respiration switch protein FrsA (DUF1100 family)